MLTVMVVVVVVETRYEGDEKGVVKDGGGDVVEGGEDVTGIVAGMVTGVVAVDVAREGGLGPYPSMVADLGLGGGVVVLW